MVQRQLTGTRIRERRLAMGMRQSDLALAAGISGSYLNLIEHNRRRIGDDLVARLAAPLGVDPGALGEGAEVDLVATLRDAAAADPGTAPPEATEDFARRFPGWAALLARTHRRGEDLARMVDILTDRLNQDPTLAAALHEMLSTATAIRATATILAENRDLEPEWRDRFLTNLDGDADRLAVSARALAGYLEETALAGMAGASPQEELDAFLTASDWHFPALETAGPEGVEAVVDAVIAAAPDLRTAAARVLARRWLQRHAADIAVLPLDRLRALLPGCGADPAALAHAAGVPVPVAMRRLACLPQMPDSLSSDPMSRKAAAALVGPVGMVSCDAAGSFTFRRALPDFPLPRHGAACPLWPLYAALSRPLTPVRADLVQAGRGDGAVAAYAIALPVDPVPGGGARPDMPLIEAHMFLVPVAPAALRAPSQVVGVTCRICPRDPCPGRREPSILGAPAGDRPARPPDPGPDPILDPLPGSEVF